MKRNAGNVLALCSVILYATGYSITEYFYGDNMEGWTFLRNTLKGFVYLFLAMLTFFPRTSLVKGLMAFMVFLCTGNLIDRLGFGITDFVYSDYVLLFFALIAGVIIYRLDVKRRDLE